MSHLERHRETELEIALHDLGGALEAPRTRVDPAHAARLRIEAGEPRRGWAVRPFGRPARRAVLIALGAVLLLTGLAAALGIGLPGLQFIFGEPPGSAPSSPAASDTIGEPSNPIDALRLGRAVPLESLDEEAGFHVVVPQDVGLDDPIAAVRVLPPGVRLASLVYRPTDRYPAGATPSVSILITQLPATLDDRLVVKFIESATTFERVTVNGAAGYWIAGGLHEIGYADETDQVVVDSIRLAGNVLAWNAGGVTYRVEGAADLETAQAIATSLR